jgi:hypothetical protein
MSWPDNSKATYGEEFHIPRIDDWLDQFDVADKYLAEHMLRKMRYVGFEEVEHWLQQELSELISDIEKAAGQKEAIAIFPVAKPFIHEFNRDKELKPANDSSGRIAHSLKNIERRLPNHIELTPRLESMRARKVRHIIFVDDFIGTGDRFIKSWQQHVSRSVKSWCSHGWCTIWVLAFAGHEAGVKRIIKRISTIDQARVRINLSINKSFISDSANFLSLLHKYGQRFYEGSAGLGYGKLLSPIVFQYGCPNNAPSIFWSNGQRVKNKWRPLFPGRSVPNDLYPLFKLDLSESSSPEEIWMAGNYELAVELIDRLNHFHGEHQLLVVLALLEKNKAVDKIRNLMVMSDVEFQSILSELLKYGLVNDQHKVTGFGKDILKRSAKSAKANAKCYDANSNFYPATFLGFQREV